MPPIPSKSPTTRTAGSSSPASGGRARFLDPRARQRDASPSSGRPAATRWRTSWPKAAAAVSL
eukprot:5372342-Pyramimonas_sp.AAC.1